MARTTYLQRLRQPTATAPLGLRSISYLRPTDGFQYEPFWMGDRRNVTGLPPYSLAVAISPIQKYISIILIEESSVTRFVKET
jgi:hypothetical protein